jgi:ABC-type nitrate/sulfonate/bicarbonate transport system substrate-binding protein
VINYADRVRPTTLNAASVPTIAADCGFMASEGLDFRVIECDGSPQALAALEKGSVDFAQVNIAPAVEEVARGAPLRIVWGSVHGDPLRETTVSSPDARFVLVSSLSLHSVDQVKGARIGISARGATNHFALVPFLREHGIDPETGVRWVEGGSPAERVNKVIDGEVDATLTMPQTLASFEGKKNSFRILSSDKDFRLADTFVGYLVMVTKEELVLAEPQAALSTVKGIIKGSRYFSENQERWVAAVAKRRPEVARDTIVRGWEQSRGHWPVNGRLDPRTVEGTLAKLKKSGHVSTLPSAPIKEWVEMSFVDKALQELGEWKES